MPEPVKLGLVVVAAVALSAFLKPSAPRYQLVAAQTGWLARMDTRSGQIAFCKPMSNGPGMGTGIVCEEPVSE